MLFSKDQWSRVYPRLEEAGQISEMKNRDVCSLMVPISTQYHNIKTITSEINIKGQIYAIHILVNVILKY